MKLGLGVAIRLAGVGLLCGAALGQSVNITTALTVGFEALPGLEYNVQGPSTLTAFTPAGPVRVVLGGPANSHDADYWKTLYPAHLNLKLAPGQQRLLLRAELFVCDKNQGLCSVQRQERRVLLMAGQPLKVTFAAPKLRGR